MRRGLLLLLCLVSFGAMAEEQIVSFHSDISVSADGSMEVVETITVDAEGSQIRRGIYRDFPTRYRSTSGYKVNVEFSMLEATRDGSTENFRVEDYQNGVRIYLGQADRFLTPGRYRYTIRYRTRYQLGFFDGYDELYWNVTGNGWGFRIQQASATVRLPAAVSQEDLQLDAFTGPQGSTAQDYRARVSEPGVIEFMTTRGLGVYSGLTVVVAFPKGLVQEPTGGDRFMRLLKDNLAILAGLIGIAGVFWFFINAWRRVGKDPAAGIVIPRYEPPEGYSPASLRYVWRMKYDSTCMAAALVNLAVKDKVRIGQEGGWLSKKFFVQKMDADGPTVEFAPGERAIYSRLLSRKRKLVFEDDNHKKIKSALDGQKKALAHDYDRKYFVRNSDKILIGAGLSVLVIVVMALLGGFANPSGFIAVAILLPTNLLFIGWMKAPTMRGRKLMDHIEGLRLYLGVAERQDLERQKEPPRTFEEFEKLLPFAVALDCANTWVDRFESVLTRMEQAGELRDRGWYTGRGPVSASNISKSVSGLSSSLASSISSSSTPPGSSSGSGGGGFSGGGGGGGGGGGW